MAKTVKRSLASLMLAAFWQAALPSLLHQVLTDAEEIHVWCPNHNRLEHLHPAQTKAPGEGGKENGRSRLDHRGDFSEQHTPCPLFLAERTGYAVSRSAAVSSSLPNGDIPKPAPILPAGLLPWRYAPKASPPSVC